MKVYRCLTCRNKVIRPDSQCTACVRRDAIKRWGKIKQRAEESRK